ncbi:ABC transporter ATP-binding protein [Alteromonas sp. a30]|uniref:ABC transporter ATP-binding protein n=1 Tax=Alteromonas sp. a30 TaxID=2730917 RepID=UPI0022819D11|nr:ABC transporter ATP-binding protein [Alteromonas sp. a30]MCY7294153.1 ABC transporter ATP-binding protein [Alteromonas sp. a30]
MARLTLSSLSKRLPNGQTLFNQLDLHVHSGEFVVLLGESGCGKTSLLHMIAGLDESFSGDIQLDSASVRHLEPEKRQFGLMTQSGSLFPHLNVADNICFPLKVSSIAKVVQQERLQLIAENLELTDFLRRYPHQLSGGQQQRVALARCLAQQPKIFLMDEPLSKLDSQSKTQLQAQIKQVQQAFAITTLYVTHDQEEASQLADRIAVLGKENKGEYRAITREKTTKQNTGTQLLQFASASEVYFQPATVQVAKVLGSPQINVIGVEHLERNLRKLLAKECCYVGVRPDAWRLVKESTPLAVSDAINTLVAFSKYHKKMRFKGRVERTELLNGQFFVYWSWAQPTSKGSVETYVTKSEVPIPAQSSICVELSLEACCCFNAQGGLLQ